MGMTPSRHQQDKVEAYQRKLETMGFEREQPYKRKPYTGPPMDLANMRSNGVHDLTVRCLSCLHDARVNVDRYPGHLAVPSFAKRMVCTSCGSRNVDVRPAWPMPKPGL